MRPRGNDHQGIGGDERLLSDGREPENGHCLVCGRAMIEHHSRACRSCRNGKPKEWRAQDIDRARRGRA